MQYFNKVCFCCAVLVVLQEAVVADKEDKSDEASDVQESSETAKGLSDSHDEAMNNREINPITKTRQKRSYEFLMGLINNNSRYQVTKDEPAINLSQKQGESDKDVDVSEVLLELIVKIAADPEQWSKVHRLLQQLDRDILTSKQLIEEYQNHTFDTQNSIENDVSKKKQEPKSNVKYKKKYTQAEINKEVAMTSDNGQPDITTGLLLNVVPTSTMKEWPTFPNEDTKVNFLNTYVSTNESPDQTRSSAVDASTTKAYPKFFSYHRVTGKPVFINKNPKAYVAVSVVAPKSTDVNTNEDLELEHELRQLKPWTHTQNLKNMESIRSRWFIDSDKNGGRSRTS